MNSDRGREEQHRAHYKGEKDWRLALCMFIVLALHFSTDVFPIEY